MSIAIRELSSTLRKVLSLLWLSRPERISNLRSTLAHCPTDLPKGYASANAFLKADLEKLQAMGVAVSGMRGGSPDWSAADSLNFATMQELISCDEFFPILDGVRAEYPVKSPNDRFSFYDPERFIHARKREMILAVLNGSAKSYSNVLSLFSDGYSRTEYRYTAESSVWRRLIANDPECPALLADDFIPEALAYALPRLLADGIPAASWLNRLEKLPDFAFNDKLIGFAAAAIHFLWMGDRKGLDSLKRFAVNDGTAYHLAGCYSFMDGQWLDAEKKFQRALSFLRKECDVDHAFWSDLTGMSYLFAAIKAPVGENKITQACKKYYTFLQSREIRSARFVTQALELLDSLANRNMTVSREWFRDWGEIDLPAAVSISQLFFHVDRQAVRADAVKRIEQCARKAEDAGYRLAAVYLFNAVKQAGDLSPADADCLLRNMAEFRLVPLWQAVSKEDFWQMALNELEKIAPDPQKQENPATQETVISWHLMLLKEQDFYDVCYIEPRLRKRKANGNWTTGRAMALNKIQAGEYDAYLRPEEQTLKAGIISYGGYGGWGGRNCHIQPRAVAGLVDNPHVFEERNGISHPIRIVEGESCLRVEKTSCGYALSLSFPQEVLAKGMTLRQESPGVYQFYRFSDDFKQLGALLLKYGDGKGRLQIPDHGEKRFQEVVARLVGTVRVVGDMNVSGVEGLRQVDGGVELHMRMHQSGSGLSLELLNRPTVELPHMFVPGQGARQTFVDSGKEKLAITRNLKQEKSCVNELLTACPALSGWEIAANRWEVDDLEPALTILGEMHDAAGMVTLEWTQGQGYKVTRQIDFGDFEFSMGFSASDWLTLGGQVKVDEHEVAHLALILRKLPEAIGDFVPLDEGKYLRLTTKMRRQLEELSGALQGKGDVLTASAGALPLLLEAIPEKIQAGFGDVWRERADAFRRALEIMPDMPNGFQGELRPYQQEGFVWLSRLYEWGVGACLADDMGLGKTVQILSLLLDRAASGPSLVIAPASVCRNWQREAIRFTPELNVRILGNTARAEEINSLQKYDVLVCSYGILVSEAELLAGKNWNCLVLDEAQAIKNHQSKRSHAARKLKAKFRLSATGTPLENHLDELWSLFDFLNPKLLGTYAHFSQKFMSSSAPAHALKKLVGPFILRRLKTQVLDELPPKTEITLEVTLSNQERSLYETLRREALQALTEDNDSNHIGILAQLTRLRRACCHPTLLTPESQIPCAKMELLADLVNELRTGGHRALIFSQFVDFLAIVRNYLDSEKISYQYLDGSTPVESRMARVDAFQHGEGDFFLISLKAGGTGLNLTAANYVILLDPWWNPAVENQAADRVHRIGQNQPVTVYRLITADTVEERVIELHARKREMAEEILDGAEKTRLSKEELLLLFQ